MPTATASHALTYHLSDDEIREISQAAQAGSAADAAKLFMKIASHRVTKIVAESLVMALSDTEQRAEALQPQDLQKYVDGLNMQWQWNTPKGTSLSSTVAAIVQPYISEEPLAGPFGIKSLEVGVGVQF